MAYLTFPESVLPAYHFSGYLSFNMDGAAGQQSMSTSRNLQENRDVPARDYSMLTHNGGTE